MRWNAKSADVGTSNAARVREQARNTLDRLRSGPLESNEIEGIKRMLLLRWAQSYKTNARRADFYVENLSDLEQPSGFRRTDGSEIIPRNIRGVQ